MIAGVSQLSWFFLFAFAVNGLIAVAILIFRNRTLRGANLLLAINLLGISLLSIMLSLVESRLILEIPHFYRTPSPIYYLMLPAGWLYVKLILTDRTSLEKTDYLHFLPALIHLIEMIPFYLLSGEEKLKGIQLAFDQSIQIFAHSEGWLPPYIHNIIRGCLAVIYAIAMWRLISKSSLTDQSMNRYSGMVIRWLKIFTINNGLLGSTTILFLTVTIIPTDIRSFFLHLVFLTVLLIPNFYLFFRPEILYGLPQPVPVNQVNPVKTNEIVKGYAADEAEQTETRTEIPLFIYEYKDRVHQYLVDSQRYLAPDFNLHDLARETEIPKHHLQMLIYKGEGKKFSEFINEYRIRHLFKQVNEGSMKNKTLEGLAAESGFGSKATFIRSVKKLTGKTPKEYFTEEKTSIQ